MPKKIVSGGQTGADQAGLREPAEVLDGTGTPWVCMDNTLRAVRNLAEKLLSDRFGLSFTD